MSAWEPKIEKNIPKPPAVTRSSAKYPFHKMEIGDSIFYPTAVVKIGTLQGAMQNFMKRNKPKRLVSRTMEEAKGSRVWRVEDEKKEKPESAQK